MPQPLRPTILIVALALAVSSAQARLPNVIVILADDLGYGDLGRYGSTLIKTPSIDLLAKSGQVFTDAYAPAATCTPSRYSLLTGDYPWRQKEKQNSILDGDAPLAIEPGRFTLVTLFKKAGYQTGIVGKWHLGLGDGKTRIDFNGEVKPGPLEIGFDYSYIIPATVDRVPSVWIENHRVVGLDPTDPIQVSYQKNISQEPTGLERPDLLRQQADEQHSGGIHNGISRIGYQLGGKVARFIDEELPDTVVAKSSAFIKANKGKPFFLFVGLFEPHVPRIAKPQFAGSSGTGLRGDVIQQADWQVGEILAVLDKYNLADDTIIIFSSDNGPILFDGYEDRSVEDLRTHSPAGPFSGGKYLVKEGGCRVPFIVCWPRKIKPGIQSQMVCLTDILATMASETNQKVPENIAIDSIDQLPTFLGATDKPARTSVVLQGISGAMALREGDWKFIKANADKSINDMGSGAKSTDPRFALAITKSDLLFNLAQDPGEKQDLSTQFQERLEAMSNKLKFIQSPPLLELDPDACRVDPSRAGGLRLLLPRWQGRGVICSFYGGMFGLGFHKNWEPCACETDQTNTRKDQNGRNSAKRGVPLQKPC
jgi:arylsulfatase A-like enzyme